MRNFYHSCKFCTLIINLAEVWPWQILPYITVFAVRLRNLLNASQRCVNKDNLTWWYVLKIFWRHLWKTSLRCLGDVLKASSKRLEDVLKMFLQDVLKTFWRRLEDVLKTSRRCLEDVLKTYDQDDYIGLDQDVLKTFSEDVWVRRIRLDQDVFKTSWRRLLRTKTKDVFKTSLRRLHQGECLLGLYWIDSSFSKNNDL